MSSPHRLVAAPLWGAAALVFVLLGWEMAVSGPSGPRWAALVAGTTLALGLACATEGSPRPAGQPGKQAEQPAPPHDAVMSKVAGVAHELNNALSGIVGYGKLLAAEPDSPRRAADVGKLCAQAERAAALVRSLLNLARGSRPPCPGVRRMADINALVEATLAQLPCGTPIGTVERRLELAPALPHTVVDRREIQAALLNLVLNAQQACAGTERPALVTISTAHRGGWIEVRVADNGCGIAEENLSRVFDPFFTTKASPEGTGLGLWLARRSVRQQGGRILVESQAGSGSALTIVLPVVTAAEQSAPSPRPAQDRATQSAGGPPAIGP